jgi:biotin transport system substrate-specific component
VLNKIIHFHRLPAADFVIKLLISLLLLAFIAPYRIEIKGETPITLQTLVILFVAIGFGWRLALPAVLIYIAAGTLGLPVFAGYTSGAKALTGPYGGFIFGFVAATIVCGYLAELDVFNKSTTAILNWFLGHLIIVLFGTLWLMQLDPLWQTRIADLLPGALIKSVTGALIIHLIRRFMTREKRTGSMV